MPELLHENVTFSKPFSFTGFQYTGHLNLNNRTTRNYNLTKCFLSLFSCMTTKEIFLELVGGLSRNPFMTTLKRFISRFDKHSVIHSEKYNQLSHKRTILHIKVFCEPLYLP